MEIVANRQSHAFLNTIFHTLSIYRFKAHLFKMSCALAPKIRRLVKAVGFDDSTRMIKKHSTNIVSFLLANIMAKPMDILSIDLGRQVALAAVMSSGTIILS